MKTKKGRDDQGLFIIEGEKLVAEIPAGWHVRAYICAESFKVESRKKGAIFPFAQDSAKDSAKDSIKQASVITVSDSRFASLSDTVTPQGIMAVCEKRVFNFSDLFSDLFIEDSLKGSLQKPFLLIGERLSDPGNIGTLIRTAAAAGASGVVLSEGSGDIYNPKTIRASAGAVLRIPVIEGVNLNEVIPIFKQQGIKILAAHLQGAVLPYDIDLGQGLAILIGNEASGLSDEISNLADIRVKLLMAPDIESLNASVAGGILFYEVVRQRLKL